MATNLELWNWVTGIKLVFRIRMDPSFFADPDPDIKNPDPDPSNFCFIKLMGFKWCGKWCDKG